MCLKYFIKYIIILLFSGLINSSFAEDRSHWIELAKKNLVKNSKTSFHGQYQPAKNVIIFIGDGMGMTTVTAARILKGQKQGMTGEEGQLSFDSFENIALSKTYNIDSQVGDSGACATALFTGVKSRFETIGLDQNGIFEDCSSVLNSRVSSVVEWAQIEGKATGLVTTTRVTHATPAAMYAHSPSRYWENDIKVPLQHRKLCKDIARQLIEDDPGRNLNVILGGGRKHFMRSNDRDPQRPDEFGQRQDNRKLIEDWLLDKKYRDLSAQYVSDQSEFDKVNTSKIDYLLGLFNANHMEHEIDREDGPKGEPSLVSMTKKAIEVLRKNPNGYLLMVESGRIDHGHHVNNAHRALTDTLALDSAVIQALKMINLNHTMVIVTADHSHVFTFGGFPKRGNPILGFDSKTSDVDGLPYTTLLYANGPGYTQNRNVVIDNDINTNDVNYIQQSAVPRKWDTHGGEDVPVYATGSMSHLIKGVVDQTYIPYAISFGLCIGPFKLMCQDYFNQNNELDQTNECLDKAPKLQLEATANFGSTKFTLSIHLFICCFFIINFFSYHFMCRL